MRSWSCKDMGATQAFYGRGDRKSLSVNPRVYVVFIAYIEHVLRFGIAGGVYIALLHERKVVWPALNRFMGYISVQGVTFLSPEGNGAMGQIGQMQWWLYRL